MATAAVTILPVLRAHSASEQLKSPDTCVAPVASVKNGLTHQKICTSSKKNTALLNQQPPNQTLQRRASAKVSQVYYSRLVGVPYLCVAPGLVRSNSYQTEPGTRQKPSLRQSRHKTSKSSGLRADVTARRFLCLLPDYDFV